MVLNFQIFTKFSNKKIFEDFFPVVCEKNERILFTVKSTGKMLKKEQKNSWVSARSNREGDKWKWFELRQQRNRKKIYWKNEGTDETRTYSGRVQWLQIKGLTSLSRNDKVSKERRTEKKRWQFYGQMNRIGTKR